MTKFRWVVLAFTFIIYTVATADRGNIGFAMPFIRKEFAMSNTQAGMILSTFFLGYALAMIPGGFLISKFGARCVFSIAFIARAAASGVIGFASSAVQLRLMRGFVGLVEAPIAVGLSTMVNNWFPPKEKGTATSIFISSSKFGPLIGPMACALIIGAWGWRPIFYIFALPWLLFIIPWRILVKDHPAEDRFCSEAEVTYIKTENVARQGTVKSKRPYKLWRLDKIIRARKVERVVTTAGLFRSWNMIGSSLGYFFMVGIVSVMMSWIPTYLVTVKHFDVLKVAFVAAAPFAGTMVGNLAGGWFSDNIIHKRRKPMMMITAASTSVMMYSLIYAPANSYLLAGLLFLTGLLLSLGYSAFVVYPMALTTKEKFPIATAITNTAGQLGGASTPLVVGMILDKYNWNAVFATLAVGSLICLGLVLTIIEPVDDPVKRQDCR